jgi:hypothetical protein
VLILFPCSSCRLALKHWLLSFSVYAIRYVRLVAPVCLPANNSVKFSCTLGGNLSLRMSLRVLFER